MKIATSGWMYDDWQNVFYPDDLQKEKQLAYYAKHFNTVEVNNTFYQSPSIKKLKKWKNTVPDDFVFSVKANRYITHMKNLMVDKDTVEKLIKKVAVLKPKLGVILFQLPPQWHVNIDRLKKFINLLPEGYNYAFEFRHKSWYKPEVYSILRENNCAFCIHDHQDAPSPKVITSEFIYLRFHGPKGKYENKYTKNYLKKMSERINVWEKEVDEIYAYFNNDYHGYAIKNAKKMIKLVKENE